MDIFTSVLGFYGTVSETDNEYKVLHSRLSYELKKAQFLIKNQKVKGVPKFMIQNLKTKIKQATEHLSKIDNLLKEDRISFKQKIKLSLPFNNTNKLVNAAIEGLEKAQQDVNQYSNQSESENNGKRSIDDMRKHSKKEDTRITILSTDEANDQDIDEVFMGPTIEEDAAIEFTKNKYVLVQVEIHGDPKIIKLIKALDESFLVWKSKIHIKFDSAEKKEVDELELFSLGRLHFKPVYTKLKAIWADVDRISKQKHFAIKLKRKRKNIKEEEKQPAQKSVHLGPQGQVFFSFPGSDQEEGIVLKESDTIVIERAGDKALYIADSTGDWNKMDEVERELCKGDEIATSITPNKGPDLYFKVHFEILE